MTIETPVGPFERCVEVRESTPLDPDDEGSKFHCPGAGMVVDEELDWLTVASCHPVQRSR
jgi:hypothetical protein